MISIECPRIIYHRARLNGVRAVCKWDSNRRSAEQKVTGHSEPTLESSFGCIIHIQTYSCATDLKSSELFNVSVEIFSTIKHVSKPLKL